MSGDKDRNDSLAPFRKGLGPELNALAEQHLQHDLNETDRDALRKAASTVSTHATIGSFVGIGLGVFLAYRLRANRTAMFNAFKAHEQPTAVRFAGGREEPLPDLTQVMKPSTLGDVATYTFLGLGGMFVGGNTGFLTGQYRMRSGLRSNLDSMKRIETAFRKFQADVLRKQADALDRSEGSLGL